MKKLFITITLTIISIQTSNAQFIPSVSSTDGISREVVNSSSQYSIPPGNLIAINLLNASTGIDTTLWEFAGSSTDGKVRFVKNKITYLGVEPGNIYATLYFDIQSDVSDSVFAKLSHPNSFISYNSFLNSVKIYDTLHFYRPEIFTSTNFSSIFRDSLRNQLVLTGQNVKATFGNDGQQTFWVGGSLDNQSGVRIQMDQSAGSASLINWYNSAIYSHFNLGTNRTTRIRMNADGTVGIGTTADVPQSLYINGDVRMDLTTSTSATSGIRTLPDNPEGFIILNISGTNYKIPFYNN
ncbi:MAG TPA: hypothetical protein PLG90_11495 [Ignavibacteria bacterium]|nr:hypothetical protein [Ignavibacteria bacterium]